MSRQPVAWTATSPNEDPPLLYRAGEYVPPQWQARSWKTPMSMRNVDAECLAVVTQKYAAMSEATGG